MHALCIPMHNHLNGAFAAKAQRTARTRRAILHRAACADAE
jgi:hypothetical protein